MRRDRCARRVRPNASVATTSATIVVAIAQRWRDVSDLHVITASADGTAVIRNVTPNRPVTDASCTTGSTSAWLYAKLPAVPCGDVTAVRTSPVVHAAGTASAADHGAPRCSSARDSRTTPANRTPGTRSSTATIGIGTRSAPRRKTAQPMLPTIHAPIATTIVARAGARYANARTGSGKSHAIGHTGTSPIPKWSAVAEASAATTAAVRL